MPVCGARGRILVVRGGAIGDFILTLPVLAALRRQFPAAHIEVLGYPHIVQLAVEGGLVNDARSIDARPLAEFFSRNGELAPELVDYFSDFDLIISYLYDPDHIFKTNVARCGPAQIIQGPHRPNDKQPTPASVVYLQPLERLAIFDADPVPRLDFRVPVDGEQTIALHPGSGSPRKNWPEARWANLIQLLLQETEANLLISGGEAEGEILQRLAAALPPTRVRVARNLPLPDLARAMQKCHLFIGHDSGISHLAAAVGLPTVVLWGHTAEAVWRPPGSKVRVVKGPHGLAKLAVESVMAQVRRLWSAH